MHGRIRSHAARPASHRLTFAFFAATAAAAAAAVAAAPTPPPAGAFPLAPLPAPQRVDGLLRCSAERVLRPLTTSDVARAVSELYQEARVEVRNRPLGYPTSLLTGMAFAAGWTPDDAAIAVTRGLLDELDRDELQGVVAHEFSHVFHGDMRLNIRLMGALAGIVCLVTIGRGLMRVRGGRKN